MTSAIDLLGLSAAEQAAYEVVLEQPSATEAELAAAWSRAEPLQPLLASLEERGLLSAAPDPPIRYAAVAPGIAFRAALLDYEERLDAARNYISGLDAAYRDRPATPGTPPVAEVVTGSRAIRQRLLQIRRGIRREVCCLGAPEDPGEPCPSVFHRIIYDRSALERPDALTAVAEANLGGHQARVLPQLPMHLYLADARLAFLHTPATETAVIVHGSALLDALTKLFEALWQRAVPLHPVAIRTTATDRPSLDRQRLITLLLSGLTDEAIARHLGCSHRSVQRRVAALMSELGAHTRFQAGAQAALREQGRYQSDEAGRRADRPGPDNLRAGIATVQVASAGRTPDR